MASDPKAPRPVIDELRNLPPKRAEAIYRALERVTARSTATLSTPYGPDTLFARIQSLVLSFTPSLKDLAQNQPPPPGFHALDTVHVRAFDLVADSVDRFIQDHGLPVRSAKRRPSPPSKLFTIAQLPALSEYPGYVALSGGDGTYLAREALKQFGSFWRPEIETEKFARKGAWIVPAEHAEKALALVREAESSQMEVSARGPEPKVRCFECGEAYTVSVFLSRPGAVASDWYCGCAEPKSRPQSKS